MPYQDFLNERTQQGGTQESKGNGNKEVGEQAEPRKPLHDKNGSQIGEVIIAEHGSILGEVKDPPHYMGGSVG